MKGFAYVALIATLALLVAPTTSRASTKKTHKNTCIKTAIDLQGVSDAKQAPNRLLLPQVCGFALVNTQMNHLQTPAPKGNPYAEQACQRLLCHNGCCITAITGIEHYRLTPLRQRKEETSPGATRTPLLLFQTALSDVLHCAPPDIWHSGVT